MTTKRLFLTQVPADFKPAHDIALGPWCFVGVEALHLDWESLKFGKCGGDARFVLENDSRTRQLADLLARKWGHEFNKEFGIQRSERYWRFLLILWMVAIVQFTWMRWLHIKEFARVHQDKDLDVSLHGAELGMEFRDIGDVVGALDGARGSSFDYWLSSRFIERIAPRNWRLRFDQDVPSHPHFGDRPDDRKTVGRIRSLLRRRLGADRLYFGDIVGVGYEKILYSALTKLLPRRRAVVDWPAKPDIQEQFPREYLELLHEVLKVTRPASVGCRYRTFAERAATLSYRPGRITIDQTATEDPTRLSILAEAWDAGERLVGSQHGGMFGVAKTAFWSTESEYKCHAFITWGWKAQENLPGNFIPLPSPLLSKLQNRHRFKGTNAILIGTKMRIYGGRFDSTPCPQRWLHYRSRKKELITALDPEVRESLVYRPYLRSAATLQDAEYVQQAFPNIEILKGDLLPRLLTCRLMIMDHPGSTLSIAMAANVPTVCCWDTADWPNASQAEPLLDKFRAVGILHDHPAEAARFIGDIWHDVAAWWHSPAVQNARLSWGEQYALADRFWFITWVKSLWKLSRQSASELQPEAGWPIATSS